MKHSIFLQAYQTKSSTLSLCQGNKSGIQETSEKQRPIERISSIWNELVIQSCLDQETILAIRNPSKRDSHDELKGELMVREIGESICQVNRYTYLITAIPLILRHLRTGGTTTLRDVYYRDVAAFCGKQQNLNMALRIISRSFSLSLSADFGIIPSPKGLIWGGNLDLFLEDETSLTLNYKRGYQILPYIPPGSSITGSKDLDVIVVMEKEAVLKSLCDFMPDTKRNVVFITGRGFPDQCTRNFLNSLRRAFPLAPAMFFVDSDVYGIRIFWTYDEREFTNSILSGVFLSDYQDGWILISKRERALLMKLIQMNLRVQEIEENEGFHEKKIGEEEYNCEAKEARLKEEVKKNLFFHNTDCNKTYKKSCKNTYEKTFQSSNSSIKRNLSPQKIIHRELTRGLLLGAKAEMNVLSNHPNQSTNLNNYIWTKIKSAGDLTCS